MCEGESWTCVGTTDISLCQKQHRQNDLAGKVDVGTTDVSPRVPTREEVHVMGDFGHM